MQHGAGQQAVRAVRVPELGDGAYTVLTEFRPLSGTSRSWAGLPPRSRCCTSAAGRTARIAEESAHLSPPARCALSPIAEPASPPADLVRCHPALPAHHRLGWGLLLGPMGRRHHPGEFTTADHPVSLLRSSAVLCPVPAVGAVRSVAPPAPPSPAPGWLLGQPRRVWAVCVHSPALLCL